VSGLKDIKIQSVEDFKKLIKLGEKARHYRQTDIHEHSSRSHSIFKILIENRINESKKIIVDKKINYQISNLKKDE
jgi:centromeric protein E